MVARNILDNNANTNTVWTTSTPPKKSKKQRIAELEARVAYLEAQLASRPYYGGPYWYTPTYPTTCYTLTNDVRAWAN